MNNMKEIKKISGKIVDVVNREIYEGTILIENGIIKEIKREAVDSLNISCRVLWMRMYI